MGVISSAVVRAELECVEWRGIRKVQSALQLLCLLPLLKFFHIKNLALLRYKIIRYLKCTG